MNNVTPVTDVIPVGKYVAILPEPEENKTKALIMPLNELERPSKGIVCSLGALDSKTSAFVVKLGDRVTYMPMKYTKVYSEETGKEYEIVPEQNIVAIINKKEKE